MSFYAGIELGQHRIERVLVVQLLLELLVQRVEILGRFRHRNDLLHVYEALAETAEQGFLLLQFLGQVVEQHRVVLGARAGEHFLPEADVDFLHVFVVGDHDDGADNQHEKRNDVQNAAGLQMRQAHLAPGGAEIVLVHHAEVVNRGQANAKENRENEEQLNNFVAEYDKQDRLVARLRVR